MDSVLPMTGSEQTEAPEQDLALVARMQKGDMSALEELIQKYQKWVYTLAYRTLKNHADADDVTQDTFIRVYRNIQQFQPKPGHQFAGWLYRVTVNLSLNQSKKRGRETAGFISSHSSMEMDEKENPIDRVPDKKANPGKEVQDRELSMKIQEALDTLSPEHRTTFTLYEMQGYSYKEISEIMQCPTGTVMSRLYYAKKVLKVKLKDYL
jgi:RNA polymerase sigma-70 factor, ECF subfamily